jgi:radical SAM superfamily enzyme YgiQ (UPF0313 family)
MSKYCIFVSAGMLNKKKEHQEGHLYLNYGLLGLATLLNDKGNNVSVYQGELFTPMELITYLADHYSNIDEKIIFISIPSFFAVIWGREFIQLVRKEFNCRIIIGGRWVLSDKNWALKEFADVDIIVNGQAESILEDILEDKQYDQKPLYINATSTKSIGTFEKLNYALLYDYKKFAPSIEVSRGCGYGCEFCADKDVALTLLKSPEKIINEIIDVIKLYGENDLKFYFQASFFNPTDIWIEQFHKSYVESKLKIQWRCETRADINLNEENIRLLSLSGLKVIDLGLESGSPTQLERMKKTAKTQKYLDKASQLLKHCNDYGIWVKVNILLYPGETNDTIIETISFLESNKNYIKGLSVYPTVIYGSDQHAINFLREIEDYGASALHGKIEETGITNLNLSPEIMFEKAKQLSVNIPKNFISQQDYFDLKSFSYYPRNYTYSDFTNLISTIEKENLPFITELT